MYSSLIPDPPPMFGPCRRVPVDEMYVASLINKGKHALMARGTPDPTALPAETVLKMATINGAKSVLWDNEIGSLEVGKKVALGFRDRHLGLCGQGG